MIYCAIFFQTLERWVCLLQVLTPILHGQVVESPLGILEHGRQPREL